MKIGKVMQPTKYPAGQFSENFSRFFPVP